MFQMKISKMTFKIEIFTKNDAIFFQILKSKEKGSQMKSAKLESNSVCSHFCNIIKYVTTKWGCQICFYELKKSGCVFNYIFKIHFNYVSGIKCISSMSEKNHVLFTEWICYMYGEHFSKLVMRVLSIISSK